MSRESESERPQRTVAELLAEYGNSGDSAPRRRRRRAEDDGEVSAPQAIIDRVLSDSGTLLPVRDDPVTGEPIGPASARSHRRMRPVGQPQPPTQQPPQPPQQQPQPPAPQRGQQPPQGQPPRPQQQAGPHGPTAFADPVAPPNGPGPNNPPTGRQPLPPNRPAAPPSGQPPVNRAAAAPSRPAMPPAAPPSGPPSGGPSGPPVAPPSRPAMPPVGGAPTRGPMPPVGPGQGSRPAMPPSGPPTGRGTPPPPARPPVGPRGEDLGATAIHPPMGEGYPDEDFDEFDAPGGDGLAARLGGAPPAPPNQARSREPMTEEMPPVRDEPAPPPGRPGQQTGQFRPRPVNRGPLPEDRLEHTQAHPGPLESTAAHPGPYVDDDDDEFGGAEFEAGFPGQDEGQRTQYARPPQPPAPGGRNQGTQLMGPGGYPGEDYEQDGFPGPDRRGQDFRDEEFAEDGYPGPREDAFDEGFDERDRRGADDLDEVPEISPAKEWLITGAQIGVGAIAGAAVWLGFSWLWGLQPIAAIVAAIVVVVGLVLVVRKWRKAEDIQTTVLAILAGLVVTVSPAALLLVHR